MPRVRVIHCKPAEAEPLLEACRTAGHDVEFDETADAAAIGRALKSHPPAAVLIDLTRLPSHGREFAVWLRGAKATRSIPLIFIDGDAAKVEIVRNVLPDAVYTSRSKVASAIKSALRNPVKQPIVPPQMDVRYKSKTTAQKLGIVKDSTAAVIDAPRDYALVVGALPENVAIVEGHTTASAVTVWFIESEEALHAGLPRMRTLASKTKLWLAWRKGQKTGINETSLRNIAIEGGLVDYKVCSIDSRWSGMLFARSKAS